MLKVKLEKAKKPTPTKKHTITRGVGRFIAGRDIDGDARTNARWSAHGTEPNTPSGHASRWAHYPHRRRAGIRSLLLTGVVLLVIGWTLNAAATATTLRVMAWFALATGVWAIAEKSRRYAHRREVVAPLAEALAGQLHDSRYLLDPHTWIHIPVDIQERPSRIYLKNTFAPTDATEKALVRLVARKIGLVNPNHTLDLRGERPFLELRPAPAPPDLVAFSDDDIRDFVDHAIDGQPFFGLGPRNVPCNLNLDSDSPHPGMSMATNAGKSTAARGLIMQNLRQGGLVLIMDRKQVSQSWCRDHPGVRYAASVEEIHAALLWLTTEIDRRFGLIKKHADIRGNVDPALIGPRLFVMAEELNTLEQDISTWWRGFRNTGDPMKAPGLAALGRAMAMGRAGRVNVFPIGQKITAQSIGGTAARENMTTRILGRASVSAWNMLAPECKVGGRYPKKSMHRGRVYVVADDVATPVQVMYVDEEVARDYAMGGVVAVFPGNETGSMIARVPSGHSVEAGRRPGEMQGPASPDEAGGEAGGSYLHLVPQIGYIEDEVVTLSQAAERLGTTLKSLRNERDRLLTFPSPVVDPAPGMAAEYRFDDLAAWVGGRRAGTGGQAS